MTLGTDKEFFRKILIAAPIRASFKNHHLDLLASADQDGLDRSVRAVARNGTRSFSCRKPSQGRSRSNSSYYRDYHR